MPFGPLQYIFSRQGLGTADRLRLRRCPWTPKGSVPLARYFHSLSKRLQELDHPLALRRVGQATTHRTEVVVHVPGIRSAGNDRSVSGDVNPRDSGVLMRRAVRAGGF
jgi:hypothetical protein